MIEEQHNVNYYTVTNTQCYAMIAKQANKGQPLLSNGYKASVFLLH
jgi:hypothetical protein